MMSSITPSDSQNTPAVTDPTTLLPSSLLPPLSVGKVRSLHALPSHPSHLLFLASDRVSAYDSPLANGIPGKGALLTAMTVFWLTRALPSALPGGAVNCHLDPALTLADALKDTDGADAARLAALLAPRALLVRRAAVLPVESIVRGYLTGSAWAEYRVSGTVHGISLPPGLSESAEIPGGPLWTPSTKAPAGEKDENITPQAAEELLGKEVAAQVREASVELYKAARRYAWERGIVIADTKFEFGTVEGEDGVVLVDEVLTPDSSRFWPREEYEVGRGQRSFDKQVLRDWLVEKGLKGKDGVVMPEEVVAETAGRYREAYERLVGEKWTG